jgi:hypothetical protein
LPPSKDIFANQKPVCCFWQAKLSIDVSRVGHRFPDSVDGADERALFVENLVVERERQVAFVAAERRRSRQRRVGHAVVCDELGRRVLGEQGDATSSGRALVRPRIAAAFFFGLRSATDS